MSGVSDVSDVCDISDVSDVSWVSPTVGLGTATWVPGTPAHADPYIAHRVAGAWVHRVRDLEHRHVEALEAHLGTH